MSPVAHILCYLWYSVFGQVSHGKPPALHGLCINGRNNKQSACYQGFPIDLSLKGLISFSLLIAHDGKAQTNDRKAEIDKIWRHNKPFLKLFCSLLWKHHFSIDVGHKARLLSPSPGIVTHTQLYIPAPLLIHLLLRGHRSGPVKISEGVPWAPSVSTELPFLGRFWKQQGG